MKTLYDLAKHIAAALTTITGRLWIAQPSPYDTADDKHARILNSSTEHTIWMHVDEFEDFDRNKHRIKISGTNWPKRNDDHRISLPHAETWPSITVAARRKADAIANDINNRFLPDYIRIWEKMRDDADQANAKLAGQQAMIRKLANNSIGVPQKHWSSKTTNSLYANLTIGSCTVKVRGGGHIDEIQITAWSNGGITYADTIKILDILEAYHEPKD